jgi:hypothetical protein
MREWDNNLDHRFVRLVVSVPEVVWMDSNGIRRRGERRRRARHTATGLACALAVVLILGAGWLVACDRALPQPVPPATHGPSTASPSAAPSTEPTVEIPVEAMLTVADLGASVSYAASDEQSRGDWSLGATMSYCTQTPWEHPGPGIAQRYRTLHSDQRSDGNMVSGSLITAVARYTGGGADRAMQAYRTGLGLCESHPTSDMTLRFVPAGGMTAADVMVVRSVVPGRTMYYAFVRQDDVVEELAFYDGADEATAVAVTARAAQRLCAAVTRC